MDRNVLTITHYKYVFFPFPFLSTYFSLAFGQFFFCITFTIIITNIIWYY